ncbi:uncharacterized protein N7483_000690 [Penicillium malachiteum]|uniref:uncharacterized protein n=1 Tax=Penicillium malachiteum TaxID=1324776 RepID=UPI002548CE4F|nr:uncharacterized protein N7483_000690 [Penicillium malachiteum]KAJ5735565.1 hypothetical protein N7483_000690 [Penicillium malachiteum]
MRSPFLLALAATSTLAVQVTTVYNFTSGDVDIENSELRPNGHLLLTTFYEGHLYTLDPHAENPKPELVAALPGATALCGITSIAYEKYAVVGGVRGTYHYDNETVYTVDFSQDATNPVIEKVAHLPTAIMLNGMAAVPKNPHIVLIGDAIRGLLFRVDTTTGASKVAIQDPQLNATSTSSLPIGVNGLKVVGNYVHFTNSARNTFGRIPVSDDGETFGEVEIIANLNSTANDWDDFIIDSNGIAYVAQPVYGIARILPDGSHSVYVGGDGSGIEGPSSIQIASDGYAYVTQGGGSVVKFRLPQNTTLPEGEF